MNREELNDKLYEIGKGIIKKEPDKYVSLRLDEGSVNILSIQEKDPSKAVELANHIYSELEDAIVDVNITYIGDTSCSVINIMDKDDMVLVNIYAIDGNYLLNNKFIGGSDESKG